LYVTEHRAAYGSGDHRRDLEAYLASIVCLVSNADVWGREGGIVLLQDLDACEHIYSYLNLAMLRHAASMYTLKNAVCSTNNLYLFRTFLKL